MSQCGVKTLKMMYNDRLEYIDCPTNAKYEECIQKALERFEISAKFKDSVQITNESNDIFDKSTFECYNILFPSPALIFYINIDSDEFNEQRLKEERKPFEKLSNKRKFYAEFFGVPVTKQNCFLGTLPGYETAKTTEPKSKRFKTAICGTPEFGVLKRTVSRRTIRI